GLLYVICALALAAPASAQFTLLHSFSTAASDGSSPTGSLLQSGTTLYGMTSRGGSNGTGTIFRIGGAAGFSLLHSFAGGASDGAGPSYGSLIQSGSTLYGTTYSGGSNNIDTIFKIGTDGTGFSLLHSFIGIDGTHPNGSLIQSGSTLYGVTVQGGSNGI